METLKNATGLIFYNNTCNKILCFLPHKGYLDGHSQLWDHADLDTSFLPLKKGSPRTGIKVHLEIRSNFRRVLLVCLSGLLFIL